MALTGNSFFRLFRKLRMGGDGVSVRTLTGNLSLTVLEEQLCDYDPGGASRNVTIHVDDNVVGNWRAFYNSADADGENLVIKNSAGTTIVTVGRGETGVVAYGGSTPAWKKLLLTDGTADMFSTANTWSALQTYSAGIATDTVAEKTAGAGVTIDGALVKDAHIVDSVGFYDAAAPTKIVRMDAGAVTAGQTRVLAMPDANVTITTAGAAILDDADAPAQRATLGVVIGTDVQAYDAELAALAAAATGLCFVDLQAAAEAGNAIAVTVNLKDAANANLSRAQRLHCRLYDAAMLEAVVGSFTMAETGAGTEISTTARPALLVDTDANGDAIVTVTDVSGTFVGTVYLEVVPVIVPGSVEPGVPAIIALTFA